MRYTKRVVNLKKSKYSTYRIYAFITSDDQATVHTIGHIF